MKVHNKGQVVIPVAVRRQLGISIGDVLEVQIIPEEGKIELRRPTFGVASALAGSLSRFARGKAFPTRPQMDEALQRGLTEDG